MLPAQPIKYRRYRRAIASLRTDSRLDQFVRYAAHCRYDDNHAVRCGSFRDDLDNIPNAARVRNRRPAKFHDLERPPDFGGAHP
jgi:hypothetical protein